MFSVEFYFASAYSTSENQYSTRIFADISLWRSVFCFHLVQMLLYD